MQPRQISTLSSSSLSNNTKDTPANHPTRRSDASKPRSQTFLQRFSIQKSKSSSYLPDTDNTPSSPTATAVPFTKSASALATSSQQQQQQTFLNHHQHQQPPIRQQVSIATQALKDLPIDHPAATTHLLTRSTLYLRYYQIARKKPSHHPPAIAYLQHSIIDARQATQNAPSLPAAWLALFSATRTAGKLQQAKHILEQALLFCPYDPTLQIALQSLENLSYQTPNSPSSASSKNPPPLRARAKDHLHLTPDQTVFNPESSPISHPSSESSQQPSKTPSLSRLRSTKSSSCTSIGAASTSFQSNLQQQHQQARQQDNVHVQQEHVPNPRSTFRFSHSHSHPERTTTAKTMNHSGNSKTNQVRLQKIQHADDAMLLGAYDDAIKRYTNILVDCTASTMSSKDVVKRDRGRLECLSKRSEAWLKKALQNDDDSYAFKMAIKDGKEMVREDSQWDIGWLRLGNAHLENGSPGKAKIAFEKGLSCCPDSYPLFQGLRDAEYVIHREGYETDWNEDNTVLSDNEDDGDSSDDNGLRENLASSEQVNNVSITTPPSKSRRSRAKENMKKMLKRQQSRTRISGRKDSLTRQDSSPEKIAERAHKESLKRRGSTLEKDIDRGSKSNVENDGNNDNQKENEKRESFLSTADKLSTAHHKLYDLLEIPKDANGAAIKRSYYNLARKYHPDKNQDDIEAKDKFQKLAEAYRVLSDPESRAIYDRYGDRGRSANSVDSIDPRTLFAMVFGSDQFVSLIGELQLASLASNVDENGNVPCEQVLNQIQRSRIGKVALEMVKMLKPWVDGDKKGFLRNMQAFKLNLQKAKYGPKLLKVVGSSYLHHTAFLDDRPKVFPFSGVIRKAHMHSHRMVSHHRAINAAEKVMEKQRKLHDRVVKSGKTGGSISHDEAKDIAIEMAETAIDMMWKISVIDIESTLEEVLAIVMNGRDLIVDDDVQSNTRNQTITTKPTPPSHDRWKARKRIKSHLIGDRRDQSNDETDAPSNTRPNNTLPPLKHGQAATTRQQVLSERARGIRAMGGLFASKPQ